MKHHEERRKKKEKRKKEERRKRRKKKDIERKVHFHIVFKRAKGDLDSTTYSRS